LNTIANQNGLPIAAAAAPLSATWKSMRIPGRARFPAKALLRAARSTEPAEPNAIRTRKAGQEEQNKMVLTTGNKKEHHQPERLSGITQQAARTTSASTPARNDINAFNRQIQKNYKVGFWQMRELR